MELPSLPESFAALNRLAPSLLDMALRSVLFLSLAGLTALVMRRASAAARHRVWLLGAAGLLLLPVLSATLPGWNILPRPATNNAAPVSFVIPPAMPSFPEAATPLQNAAPIEKATVAAPTEPKIAAQRDTAPAQATAPEKAVAVASPAVAIAAKPIPASSPTLSGTAWLLLIWLAGTLLVLAHVALGHLSLWSLQHRCAGISQSDWLDLLGQLSRQLRIGRKVQLLQSTQRTMPMTWGLWNTRLLLPQEASAWTPEHKKAVMLHELAHVKRRDSLAQFLAQIACALYWFNPLIWIASRRMQVERERACDDLVLNAGAKASTYAEHVLESAWAMPSFRFIGPAVAMARPSTLEERLRAILDPRSNRRALTTRGNLAAILLLTAALLPITALHAQENPVAVPAPGDTPGVTADPTPAPRPVTPSTGGRAGPRMGGNFGGISPAAGIPASAQATPTLGEGPTCALDATIYDVRIPKEKIGLLDVEALTRASKSAADFEKALADLGTFQPLYRASQSVRLAGDSITIGTSTPYIAGSQMTANGQSINTVAYTQTGAVFSLAGKADQTTALELDLGIQISAMSEGITPITPTIKAPVMRRATMSHKGLVEAGKPFVAMSIDAASVDADGKAVAYIARIILGAPQSSIAPAPAHSP